jgi:DNA polymerase-1
VYEGSVSVFSHRGKVPLIPLDRIREDYPNRVPELIEYASNDAKFSLELMPHREAQLASRPAKFGSTLDLYRSVWHPMLLVLNRMERSGITVDRDHCGRIQAQAEGDMAGLLPGIQEFAGDAEFNPGSRDQLAKLLFEQLDLRRPPIGGTMFAIRGTKPEEWSTSEASLHWLQIKHPEHNAGLDLIRRWRKIRRNAQFGRDIPKYISPVDGRVHTVFGPEADTGRLSAKLFALQQIPSKNDKYGIRGAFVAAPGTKLIVADYSQLEVYVLAHMLIRLNFGTEVRDALASGDVYSWIARQCWTECAAYTDAEMKSKGKRFRDLAKILVLATNYGKTPMGLALSLLDELGEPADEGFCQGLLDTYMNTLPSVGMWQEWIARYGRANRGVPTLLGRWRPLLLAGTNRGDRQALNSPIQGGAADIAVLGMLGLNTYSGVPGWFHEALAATGARLLLQVHDELVFEVPEDRAEEALPLIEHGMTHPPVLDLAVQLKVEAKIATTWKDGK